MNYFNNCRSIEEVKALYHKLAMENHPDRGGDTAVMQAINTEYAKACAFISKGADLTEEETEYQREMSEEYIQVIQAIIGIDLITIEIVGNWIWVTGNTYPVRKKLSEAGLLWAPKKKAWYYRSEEFKSRGRGGTLDEIRAKYGSQTVHNSNPGKYINK